MTDTSPIAGAPAKLAELLETLPSADRQELVAWLLGRPSGNRTLHLAKLFEPGGPGPWLPATGEASQIVTVRLPSEQHERLRTWCTEHNFSMAAVVRGLVERFLESQSGPGTRAA